MKRAHNPGMRWCGYISDIYICILFSLFILICAPYEEITKIKYSLFLWVCGGFVALTVISVLELLIIGQIKPRELTGEILRRRGIFVASGIYLLCTLISALISPYEYNSIIGFTRYEGLATHFLYIAVFLTLSVFGRIKKYHIHILGVTAVIFSILCLMQIYGNNPFMLYPAGYGYRDAYTAYPGEYLGTIGNADLVSGFLSVIITLFSGYLLIATSGKGFWLIIPLILCVTVLIMSGVASGILTTVVSMVILLPYSLIHKKSNKTKYVLFAEGAIIIAVLIFIYTNNFGGTLGELGRLLHGESDPSFGSHRFMIWEKILAKMPENLWFGTGPDSMGRWEFVGFSKQIGSQYVEQIIDIAHNEYLNIAAQQGILCLGAYAMIIFCTLKCAFTQKNNSIAVFLTVPVIAYLVQAFFGFSMCAFAPFFWTFAGILTNKEEFLLNNEKSV